MECARPDFLIIGAQKAGTTSLSRYLASHPNIFMPPEKEANFWSDPERVRLGIESYLSAYFSRASEQQIWGEASPRYMFTPNVAAHIRAHCPFVKLVAILRDPIARAHSHYRMSRRRGFFADSFDQAVARQAAAASTVRTTLDENTDILALGEYGRQLEPFFDTFGHERMCVIFLEDLAHEGEAVVRSVFQFLGVDEDFHVSVLGTRFNVGGEARSESMQQKLWYRASRRIARAVVPAQTRRAVGFWLDTEWNVQRSVPDSIGPETRALLTRYYGDHVRLLESLIGRRTPWKAWQD